MWPGKLKIIEHQAQEILSGMLSLDRVRDIERWSLRYRLESHVVPLLRPLGLGSAAPWGLVRNLTTRDSPACIQKIAARPGRAKPQLSYCLESRAENFAQLDGVESLCFVVGILSSSTLSWGSSLSKA